ncbi:hypothetical protein BJX61DRAFT_533172 [Aspergillus egyptiacus]|nr:hypothetical protein BJX61DRAFT_533172 [Aspergillus egyptiacus]
MPEVHQPCFEPQIIHRREDGYWIDTFYYHKDDKAPGLIVSGLKGKVEYLENPKRTRAGSQEDERKWIYVEDEDSDDGSSSASDESSASSNGSSSSAEEEADPSTWTAYQICHLYTPVPMASLDITGNGYNDIIVGYNFGPTMINSERNGGDIIWLENPGDNPKREWKRHFIGRWPAIHRLAVGYFTQRTFPEIIAAPVSTPVPLIIFQKPDNNTCKKVGWFQG